MKKPVLLGLLVSLLVLRLPAQQTGPTAEDRRERLKRIFSLGDDSKPVSPSASPKPSRPRGETETWQLFPAGKLPAGKMVGEADAAQLAVGNYLDQSLYLIGNFNVTADGEHKAVLRFVDTRTPIRIIAEYSSDVTTPSMGSKLKLDPSRGLLVRTVSRARNDGSLLIFVRDITLPPSEGR
jgi:hypothetical protein